MASSTHLDLNTVLEYFSTKTEVNLVLYHTYPGETTSETEPASNAAWELTFETPDGITIKIDSNAGVTTPPNTNVSITSPEIDLSTTDYTYDSLSEAAKANGLGVSLHNSGVVWARESVPGNEKTSDSVVDMITDDSNPQIVSVTSNLNIETTASLDKIDSALSSLRTQLTEIK